MPERNGRTDGQTDILILLSISRVSILTRDENLDSHVDTSIHHLYHLPPTPYKCKKLWFIHELTAHHTSKTAKITKR